MEPITSRTRRTKRPYCKRGSSRQAEAPVAADLERTMEDASPHLKKNAPKSTRGNRGKHRARRFGAGRKKGLPNKLNPDIVAAVMEAFSEVGGAEYLRRVAR